MHKTVLEITRRIEERSKKTRALYQEKVALAKQSGNGKDKMGCSNVAHAFAACPENERRAILGENAPNIGIVSAYNDMLSAHAPLRTYPEIIKKAALEKQASAQFAGGVPAMCDGVTQGEAGMELSLFSRDVIALATAIALSHNVFDGALCLGVCDKIIPGLLIGALSFGHLPIGFIPAGPMPSGISNSEKAEVRNLYAEGKASRAQLLQSEQAAYHGMGTCTFYGTANTNQLLLEVMGLQLPSASFTPPNTPLREALTRETVFQTLRLGEEGVCLADMVGVKALVNGCVALLASGGSTNLTIHLIAIAHAAGYELRWEDMEELSEIVPLLIRAYPNGSADVNAFHEAGGIATLIQSLHEGGLIFDGLPNLLGNGLEPYMNVPSLKGGRVVWEERAEISDENIIRPLSNPFSARGGLCLLRGNLGEAIIKTSAVKKEHLIIEAPAHVFCSQEEVLQAFEEGVLERDVIIVLRGQGPKANGMPELHKLTAPLSVLQGRGFQIALLTDGRMSGASGRIPSAIHLTPEAAKGGNIGKLKTGDIVSLDAEKGRLNFIGDVAVLEKRKPAPIPSYEQGMGRELFTQLRGNVGEANRGASIFGTPKHE